MENPMDEGSQPITRADLDQGLAKTEAELKEEIAAVKQDVSELKQDVSELKQDVSELKQDVSELKRTVPLEIARGMNYVAEKNREQLERFRDEIFQEIGRAARAGAEEHRREIGAVDDRYRDLPGRVAVLERELTDHRQDVALHARPRSRRSPK
jgi:predicted RNase H-like nuclease (RuvC/YqgF family)